MEISKKQERLLRVYAEKEEQNADEFLTRLLGEALEQHALKRSGGLVATIPNPQFYQLHHDNVIALVMSLKSVAHDCNMLNVPIGLDSVTEFLLQRIIADTPELRVMFEKNLLEDSACDEDFFLEQ